MEAYFLEKMVSFSSEGQTKNIFFESEKLKAQVIGLEAGKKIPPCRMDQDVIFIVLSGRGRIIVDGEEQPMRETSFIFVPKEKESRSLQAETRMAILAIQVRV